MLTEELVKTAIEKVRDLTDVEYTKFVFRLFDYQKEVSQFINGGHYRVINVSERHVLNYYIFIAYEALKTAYGESPLITTDSITKKRDEFLQSKILEQCVTVEPILEERLKLLIHGNWNVRTKSVLAVTSTVCAFIELYDKRNTFLE
jgi:hypothetical protein